MSKVTITLKDVDGAVEANVVFSGDFDKTSPAHQVANLVLKHLDEVMRKQTEVEGASV